MKKWFIYIGDEKREFWAKSGDDCYRSIRLESLKCVAGFQRG